MQITKAELIQCKRAIVVLQEINKIAVATLREPDMLAPVKADLFALVNVVKRLEREAV